MNLAAAPDPVPLVATDGGDPRQQEMRQRLRLRV